MLSCHIFSIAQTGVLQYIHPEGLSYPQFQEIITCINLRQMDNFRLVENIFSQQYNFRYSHFMVKPWFNHELAMV